MIRTIDQMESESLLIDYNCYNVSDTLTFCIVAGDYLRAKRRRFPLDVKEVDVTEVGYPFNQFELSVIGGYREWRADGLYSINFQHYDIIQDYPISNWMFSDELEYLEE